MGKFTIGEACPQCKSRPHARMKRSLWMRMVPLSKHYHCTSCNSNFVSMEDTLSFSWRTAPPPGQQPFSKPQRRPKKGFFRFQRIGRAKVEMISCLWSFARQRVFLVHNSAQIPPHQCVLGALLRVTNGPFIFEADGSLTPFHNLCHSKIQPSLD